MNKLNCLAKELDSALSDVFSPSSSCMVCSYGCSNQCHCISCKRIYRSSCFCEHSSMFRGTCDSVGSRFCEAWELLPWVGPFGHEQLHHGEHLVVGSILGVALHLVEPYLERSLVLEHNVQELEQSLERVRNLELVRTLEVAFDEDSQEVGIDLVVDIVLVVDIDLVDGYLGVDVLAFSFLK